MPNAGHKNQEECKSPPDVDKQGQPIADVERAATMIDVRRSAITVAGRLSGVWLRSPLGRQDDPRVLAYHEIRDAAGFERQLAHLTRRYHPVSSADVLATLDGAPLPRRAVWVTFDDGYPSVVEEGLPLLQRYGVPATMFVCPGVIDTSEPYWWQVVEAAADHGLDHDGRPIDGATIARLKAVADDERRTRVAEIRSELEQRMGTELTMPQLTSDQLQAWIASGNTVGNHTWDHPLLDRCNGSEQQRQIELAHDWLVEHLGEPPTLFAYPNGNWAEAGETTLRRLGYRIGVLFDHRIATLGLPLQTSRIRTTADADFDRFRAMVSGLHPVAHALRTRSLTTR